MTAREDFEPGRWWHCTYCGEATPDPFTAEKLTQICFDPVRDDAELMHAWKPMPKPRPARARRKPISNRMRGAVAVVPCAALSVLLLAVGDLLSGSVFAALTALALWIALTS